MPKQSANRSSERDPRPELGPGAASSRDGYVSPLSGRYASAEMQAIWSERRRIETWRKVWLAVAEAQHEMGLPVSWEQVEELRANLNVTDADLALAAEYEKKLRHDVMAHVHAWGERCPKAKGIIHLGLTSQDVNDNAELILMFEACELAARKAHALIAALGEFAQAWRRTPTLGLTHFQPAQPTTVGRRAAQWACELGVATEPLATNAEPPVRVRGFRGATGTQASFLALLSGDRSKVERLEAIAVWRLLVLAGFEEDAASFEEMLRRRNARDRDFLADHTIRLTAQTYPRVWDARIVGHLAEIACVLHKIATDIRLLSNRKEMDEPFEESQVGSSAMPYKRNPMRCERVCALSRFVWNLVGNAYDTAATQWLERTLDDSANRRLVLPEAFLALDGALETMLNVARGLVVHEAMVRRNLMAELPFLATENIMMEAVKLGRDRQDVHEAIRRHAQAAALRVKQEGAENDLIERLKKEPLLKGVDLEGLMDPMKYVGLAVEQTERFVKEVVEPLRKRHGNELSRGGEVKV